MLVECDVSSYDRALKTDVKKLSFLLQEEAILMESSYEAIGWLINGKLITVYFDLKDYEEFAEITCFFDDFLMLVIGNDKEDTTCA